MPATPARIAFISEEYRRVVASSLVAVTRHGNLARKSEDPIPTFFDNTEDAQAIADARQELLSADRRRFKVVVNSPTEVLAIMTQQSLPIARYIDPDRDIDMPVIIADMTVDHARGAAILTVWG